MKFEHIEIADKELKFESLHYAAESLGFVHAEQWDYERVMFDLKIHNNQEIYYLRVPAYAIKGDIPKEDTIVKVMAPILGKYYYPHGVEYAGEDFPKTVVEKCNTKLTQLLEAVNK
ncbi:YugN family protein [Alkalihalobacillus sp. 1P02AB]|uniref:YugN family protein n=1 Tax=Alkalihalobacillus sp. 1P02AB TaxID=3132260 RepID=UPI0039A64A8A